MNYREALAWLYGTQGRGIKLGLGRMRELLAGLGWGQGSATCFHVAGTNGKGSVCAIIESICRAHGMRTGLFTSPHLVTFRERIRINGEMVSETEIAAGLTRIRKTSDDLGIEPTFFEITTALAFEIFRAANLNAVILETGLGGRLDSTNVIDPAVSVITSIGLDHTELLGNTLAAIAAEKAGIIKPGKPVVIGPLPDEAVAVISETAAKSGSQLIRVAVPYHGESSLHGPHQRMNAAVAIAALKAASRSIPQESIAQGLASINWPGRFQNTGRGFILDGTHNPEAAARLAETWCGQYGAARTQIILGIVKEKDAAAICAALASIAESFSIVPVNSPRALPIEDLKKIAANFGPTTSFLSLSQAIAATPPNNIPTLIAGSLFLVGEALVLLGLAEGEQEISTQ